MALNPNIGEEYNKVKMPDLIEDAIERGDEKALEWLEAQSIATIERTRNGKKQTVKKGISAIRAEYARNYLGYKPNNKKSMELAKERKAKKEEEARKAMFADARKRLMEKKGK